MRNSSSVAHLVRRLRGMAEERQPGDQLPTTRSLVVELGVSPVTVTRALAQLAAEGVVLTEPGRGTFVAPRRRHNRPDAGWQTVVLGQTRVDGAGLARLLALPDPPPVVNSERLGRPDYPRPQRTGGCGAQP